MSRNNPKSCSYCPFCSKIKHKGYTVLLNPWVPPNLTEYECLRVYRKIGRAGELYKTPDWCPEKNKN